MRSFDLTVRSTIIDTRVEKFRNETYNVITVKFKPVPVSNKPVLRVVK